MDKSDIERWAVRFPEANPSRLPEGDFRKTYTIKPLVAPFDEAVFGELAILRCLESDGWQGVWVDTFHGAELFWRNMPHLGAPERLEETPRALNAYRKLVREHGKRGGFFDVFAWRGDFELLFIEYKGRGDSPNANESSWIDAALRCGIKPTQLMFAEYA